MFGLLTIGGCANSDSEIATLKTPGVPQTTAAGDATGTGQKSDDGLVDVKSSQRMSAEEFYACLTAAGLPAAFDDRQAWAEPGDDEAEVRMDREGRDILMVIPGQTSILWAGKSGGEEGRFGPAEEATFQEHVDSKTYLLTIDGIDYTETLESCHRESGYADPGSQVDPPEELLEKQAIVEPTNAWISCARDNGMPNLQELTAIADNWETSPKAVIPYSTSVEQLRALLETCPNFDEDMARLTLDPDFTGGQGYVRDPVIWIEDIGDPLDEHYTELYDTVWQRSMEFWDANTGD
ncbi:MAG: hypothetical protein LBK59_08625 [Bifidobacteriaceae bacterium]|nr:hypothetical protein [Bifidobacteriaceae bacterium]